MQKERIRKTAQPVLQVTLLHVIRPCGRRLYTKICCKEMHIHHPDCVIVWVMRSYAVRLYRTEAAGREKHLQFTAVHLPCCVCMYSINPFTVGKYYAVNTHGNRKTNMLNIHIRDFNQSLSTSSRSPSFFFLVLSFFPSFHVFLLPYVICQSLISMSWRHLYSRQTQGGMCWWLSAVAIYHLSSFCPLRR